MGQQHCFEIVDPRLPGLPRFVGFGQETEDGQPPWWRRWQNKSQDASGLAAWMRELDAVGLQPVEDNTWLPRGPVNHRTAEAAVKARIRQISSWAGTAPSTPRWLFNFVEDKPKLKPRQPVCRLHADGRRREWYRGMKLASEATRLHLATILDRLKDGRADRDGCLWFEASDECSEFADVVLSCGAHQLLPG